MKKQADRYIIFLLICFWGFAAPKSLAQTIEQAYGLRFRTDSRYFQNSAPYWFTIDSTQVTNDGFHPLRLRYNNVLTIHRIDGSVNPRKYKASEDCSLFSSRTVVIPANAHKKDCCTVTLNYKSEIEGLRFIVIAWDKKENTLYTDSVILPASDQWTNSSFTFCRPEARSVSIIIRREGCDEAYQGRSIWLNKVSIRLGDQNLNDLPITSLVQSNDIRLKRKAIIPLSLENDASLAKIQDWKDKKIIALGESTDQIQDIREVQVQLMKHLITAENCKLIMLKIPQNQCFRWNLYLQGKRPDSYGNKILEELKVQMYSPAVFFKFLQWVRQYNAKSTDPVRIVGIEDAQDGAGWNCLVDYLLDFSTNRQDSVYYLKALKLGRNFSDISEHILQSKLSGLMSKQDFQYLLFLIEEMENMNKRPLSRRVFMSFIPESSFDRAKRVERVIDIYLSPSEKAVIMAYSGRINKNSPIYDVGVKYLNMTSDSLGCYLNQRYGNQYHAVSIQIGERTCLADTSSSFWGDSISLAYHKKKGIPLIYPVKWKPPFPFAFEQAAMDCGIPYFYYPSNQLSNSFLGLNLLSLTINDVIPFCNCHIPSQFDALVFIREAKACIDYRANVGLFDPREYFLDIDKLLKELGE